jgi:hypothetical protein
MRTYHQGASSMRIRLTPVPTLGRTAVVAAGGCNIDGWEASRGGVPCGRHSVVNRVPGRVDSSAFSPSNVEPQALALTPPGVQKRTGTSREGQSSKTTASEATEKASHGGRCALVARHDRKVVHVSRDALPEKKRVQMSTH